MSNSVQMLRRLSKLCKGYHKHVPLLGGKAAEAAFYPLPLIKAILQGISDTKHASQSVSMIAEEEYDTSLLLTVSPVTVDTSAPVAKVAHAVSSSQEIASNSDSLPPGKLPVQGGGFVNVQYAATECKTVYLDEYTREPLPRALAKAAIRDELE